MVFDRLRRERTKNNYLQDVRSGKTFSPLSRKELSGLSKEEDYVLQEWVSQLVPEDRELVVLKIFQSLTFEEISTITDHPKSTLASRYNKAMEELRKRWQELDK